MTSSTPASSNSGAEPWCSSTRSTSSGAVRVKNETRRWYCFSSSTIARSKSALKMSRTTRTDRSASWKTSDGRRLLLDALLEDLVELEEVRQLTLEVLAHGAVRGGAHDRAAALEVEALHLAAQALALLVLQALGDAEALTRSGCRPCSGRRW